MSANADIPLTTDGTPMACICSLPLGSLLTTLPSFPNLTGLIPAMPLQLVVAINAALNISPLALSANLSATATAQASLTANLAIMASLVAAVKAAMNLNLALPLSVSAMANLRANLSANIHSMNAHGLMLGLALPNLMALLLSLLPLIHLMGIVVGARLAFGIDLRAPGAVLALQAALNASLAARLGATANMSAVAALMAALGFAATAQGALGVNACASVIAGLSLPAITVNFHALSLLGALLALLPAIHLNLGINLQAPTATAQLKAFLGGLPLAALAQMRLAATATANVAATAAAAATTSLNLAATANANLSAAARLAVLVSLTANASFLLKPPGTCGLPCPIGLVGALV